MRHLLTLSFIFFAITATKAAESSLPSLDQLLQKYEQANDKERQNVAKDIFSIMAQDGFGPEETYPSTLPPDSLTLNVWYYSAEYLLSQQRYEECIKYVQKALPLARENNDYTWESECLNLLTLSNLRLSRFIYALDYGFKMYETDKAHDDLDRQISSLNTIAGIYLAARQPDEAEQFVLSAIDLAKKEADNTQRLANVYGIASEVYQGMQKPQQALDYARRALLIDIENHDDVHSAVRRQQMASAYISIGEFVKAEEMLKTAMPVLQQAGDYHTLGVCLNLMGEVMRMEEHEDQATNYFTQANELFAQLGDRYNQLRSLHGLYASYFKSDPERARLYLDQYHHIRDSINNQEFKMMLASYNAQYQNNKLQQQNDTTNSHYKRFKFWSWLFICLLFFAVVTLMFFLWMRTKTVRYLRRMLNDTELRMAEQSLTEEVGQEPSIPTEQRAANEGTEVESAREEQKQQKSTGNKNQRFIEQLTSTIHSLILKGNLNVESLAQSMYMSTSQLRRKVYTSTGESPVAIIQRERMSYACQLMKAHPDWSIGDIATKCGFDDNSNFTRSFKQVYNITPTQYRKENI